MNGTGGGAFSPSRSVTRGMLVTILYRLEGEPAVTNTAVYSDVAAGRYCTAAVAWAAENGIVNGYADGSFHPDDAISREQLAAILYRYALYKGYDTPASASLAKFSDSAEIGSYARAALAWANAEGLVNGTSSGTIAPKSTATRAQTAVILMRFLQSAA